MLLYNDCAKRNIIGNVLPLIQVTLRGQVSSMQSYIDRLYLGCEFIDRLLKHAPPIEALGLKKLVASRIKELMAFQPDDSNASATDRSDLEFVSNFQV